MNEPKNPNLSANTQQQTELEFLHAVLSEDLSHPWNPYSPAAAEYLDRLESEADADLEDDIVIDSQWSQVSTLAAALWDAADARTNLSEMLAQKFGARMPRHLLGQLAGQAQAAADSGQALIDQLVVSAQAVLTGWDVVDLQVMARPALAMRSGQGESLEAMVESIRPVDWDELTEMEQARLALVIARYALAKLDTNSEN
ncbi:MAG: hypothetical protein AAF892_04950 [Cyanobacteria bacterium P01_D01_bin.71]